MRPAGGLGDRTSLAGCLVEPVEAGIAIGLQDAAIAAQVTLGVLAGTVARVEEHCRRRIAATEWTIVAHVDPGPSGRGLPLGEHRHRGLVAMHALAGEHVCTDQIEQRLEQRRATAHLVGERRQAQLDALAGVAL
jgi:hypothetical protein